MLTSRSRPNAAARALGFGGLLLLVFVALAALSPATKTAAVVRVAPVRAAAPEKSERKNMSTTVLIPRLFSDIL